MSFPKYPEYSPSKVEWLGGLPSHWREGRLKHFLRIRGGQDYRAVESEEASGYPVIGSGGQFTYATDYLYDGESVLLGRKGTIDKPLYVTGKFWTVDTMFYTEVLPGTCGRYAYYAATTLPFSLYSTNTALPSMSQFDLANHMFALPPHDEQQKIAAFLDHETAKIDVLIAEQQRLIELLKEKRQAVISHAVTKGLNPNATMKDSGVEWLGEVPAHWRVAKLSFRYSVELGKMLDEKKVSGEYLLPYLRNRDVQWGRVNVDGLPAMDIKSLEMDRYTVSHGDLLVCEGGEVGRAAIWRGVSGKIGYQKALHRLRPLKKQRDTVEFFFYVLEAAVFRGVFEQSEAKATIAHLPAEQFRQYRFPFPPLSEQIEIANFLKVGLGEIESLFSASEELVESLQERRSSLISAAVTGKIDVRGWQPSESASPEPILQAAEEAVTYG